MLSYFGTCKFKMLLNWVLMKQHNIQHNKSSFLIKLKGVWNITVC